MYNYTEDEVRQVEIDSIRSDVEKLKKNFNTLKDIRTMKTKLRIGECYLINIDTYEYKGVLLDIDNLTGVYSFICSGSGLIGALERKLESLWYRDDIKYMPLGRSCCASDYNVMDEFIFYGSVIKIDPDKTDGRVFIRELR